MSTVLISPDSFKGNLSAQEVAEIIASQWQQARPADTVLVHPMADGGEGTMDAILTVCDGEIRKAQVPDPLGRLRKAYWGWLPHSHTAIIEMAQASGLQCMEEHERDALHSTTYGTGSLIQEALNAGAQTVYLTLGGSATNDAGAGMMSALGVKFKNAQGHLLSPGGAALAELATIGLSTLDSRIENVKFIAACDVTNPLCGKHGASAVFGPQKGATQIHVKQLDNALTHYAEICADLFGKDLQDMPGAGAAGGTGFAALTFLNAEFLPGFKLVAQLTGLEQAIRGVDLVITGEGKLDAQVMHGKTILGITQIAASNHVPVIAIVGALEEGYQELYALGLTAAFSISKGPMSLSESLSDVRTLLADRARDIARLSGILAR